MDRVARAPVRAALIAGVAADPSVAWVTWNGPFQRLVVQPRGDAAVALAAVRAASFAGAIAERTSMLYADTSIAAGRAVALVVAVGEGTEARRAHAFTREAEPRGVQARLEQLTRLTSPAAAVAGLGIVASGLLRNRPVRELIDTAVSLAVAAVPETLPLLATAAELAAARRLSQRGALVRNISAVEALGRVDVLCADKTGTLTEGVLRLRGVATGAELTALDALDADQRDVLRVALAASPAAGDTLPHPTDRALVEGASAAGIPGGDGARENELPFEPGRGYHATLVRSGRRRRLCVKGAPDVVLARCARARIGGTSVRLDADLWLARAHALAGQGFRILAVADRSARSAVLTEDAVDDLVFRGLLAIADPVRPAARASIDALRRAGVRTVMITGDHPATARAIATEVGLGEDPGVCTGAELEGLDDDALDARLGDVAVFARVTPQLKVRLVAAFQRAGQVVAMTGDGANGAPAIRLADVGIALGERATPAARSAADVLVTVAHDAGVPDDGRAGALARRPVAARARPARGRDRSRGPRRLGARPTAVDSAAGRHGGAAVVGGRPARPDGVGRVAQPTGGRGGGGVRRVVAGAGGGARPVAARRVCTPRPHRSRAGRCRRRGGHAGRRLLPPAWRWADGRFALGALAGEASRSELGRWIAESRVLRRLRERSRTAAELLDDGG